MNVKSQIKSVLAAIVVGLCLVSASYAQRPPIVGGYKSIPADGAEANEAAEFAVAEQSEKQGVAVELGKILSAARQVVQGTNYRLCIEANVSNEDEESETKQFLVEIYRNLQNEFTLKSWKQHKCAK